MDLLATLRRSGGVSAVAVQLDEAPAQVDQGVEALLPLLVSEMRAEVARLGGGDEGIAALVALFDREGDGSLASRLLAERDVDPAVGYILLDRICREPGSSERLAGKVTDTELDKPMLARLAALLMMLVGGYMSARSAGTGAAGSGGPRELGELYEDLLR